jgi:hypothetical protein
MDIAAPPVTPPAHKDRKGGLVAFGIIDIVLGLLCLLMAPLAVFGQVMAAKMSNSPPNFSIILPTLIFYPLLSVAFIWLGIGSMRCQRWARALMLILSSTWLLMGITTLVMFLVMSPAILRAAAAGNQGLPPEARVMIMAAGVLAIGVFFIVVPGAMVLFYRSPHVKATCEALYREPAWTDRCPLPVLAISVWLFVGALMMPVMPIAYNSVVPLFGFLVSGVPGTVIFLLLSALFLYAAWAIYRLNVIGWWIAVISMTLLTLSSILTFARINIMDMYRAMNYPEAQLKQIEQMQFSKGQFMLTSTAVLVLILGYLLFIKRYFRRSVQTPLPATAKADSSKSPSQPTA